MSILVMASRQWRRALSPTALFMILVSCDHCGGAAPAPGATPALSATTRAESAPPATAPAPAAPTSQRITIEGRPALPGGTAEDALRAHAASLIPCPKDQIKVREILLGRTHNPSESVFADGCGQRVVYASSPTTVTSRYPEYYVVSRFSMGYAAGGP